MFKRQTLFVLGAGSSAEVGMPVGATLSRNIAGKMDIRFDGGTSVGTGDLYTRYSGYVPIPNLARKSCSGTSSKG
jgi:hypothetical protein